MGNKYPSNPKCLKTQSRSDDKFDQMISGLDSFYVELLKDPFTVYVIFACLFMIIIAITTATVRKLNKRKKISKI